MLALAEVGWWLKAAVLSIPFQPTRAQPSDAFPLTAVISSDRYRNVLRENAILMEVSCGKKGFLLLFFSLSAFTFSVCFSVCFFSPRTVS